MKKILINIGFLILVLSQTSCDDFLKEDSGDLLIPKSVEDFIPVLYGEGYPKKFNSDVDWFKLMTDDVEMGPLDRDPNNDYAEGVDNLSGGDGRQAYIWSKDIEEKITDYNWNSRYENILGCNTIIDALPTMVCPAQDTGKYNFLAAQAYALRAYHYFCLINSYALPWAPENLDKLGVIIRTTPQIQVMPRERSTIGEVYDLINEDLITAEKYTLNAEVSGNKHLMSPIAIKLLATRVALFQEKWDEVITKGTEFLAQNSFILDLNSIDESKMGTSSYSDFTMLDLSQNNEIVFTFGSSSSNYNYLSGVGGIFALGFRVSYSDDNSLIKCYGESDLRRKAFFKQDVFKAGWPSLGIPDEITCYNNEPIKYKGKGGYRENWRTVEVVLNLAEAYARKSEDISQDAIDLLNQLRVNRIKEYQNLQVSDFPTKQDLVKFIWDERRRELCFEEAIRFWDLRRQGMPQLIHKYYGDETSFETYTLKQGSPNYVLAIPRAETSNNYLVTSNERDVINAQ